MNTVKRYIILASILCFIQIHLDGQENGLGSWLSYFGNQKISDRWNLQSDFQIRDYQIVKQRNQLLLRAGLGYNLKENNHNLLMGFAYIATDGYDENNFNTGRKFENRLYQQYTYKNKLKSIAFSHRFRVEERFFPNEFGLRGRYFIAAQKPLIFKYWNRNNFYFSGYNEIFIDLKATQFDRNRFYGGLGFKINDFFRVETGYMIQSQKNITRGQLQMSLFHNWSLK